MSQVVNVGKNIKNLLFDNWSLKDELDRKKIFWSGNMIPPKMRQEKVMTIEINETIGTGTPKSGYLTQHQDLYMIHFWRKLVDPQSPENLEKVNTDRKLVINEIMKLIHDNQTLITGIKIAKIVRTQSSDEFEASPFWLHTIIWVRDEWFHSKT